MYNNSDIINDVSIRECFHSILDAALEHKKIAWDESEKYFDIIRKCLGIDFSEIYNVDKDIILIMDYSYYTEECFETNFKIDYNEKTKDETDLDFERRITKRYMHEYIDKTFDLITPMVVNGNFNDEYYSYLKDRSVVLEDLIHYFETYSQVLPLNRLIRNMNDSKEREKQELSEIITITKIEKLKKTQKLLNSRIEEIKAKSLVMK